MKVIHSQNGDRYSEWTSHSELAAMGFPFINKNKIEYLHKVYLQILKSQFCSWWDELFQLLVIPAGNCCAVRLFQMVGLSNYLCSSPTTWNSRTVQEVGRSDYFKQSDSKTSTSKYHQQLKQLIPYTTELEAISRNNTNPLKKDFKEYQIPARNNRYAIPSFLTQ